MNEREKGRAEALLSEGGLDLLRFYLAPGQPVSALKELGCVLNGITLALAALPQTHERDKALLRTAKTVAILHKIVLHEEK